MAGTAVRQPPVEGLPSNAAFGRSGGGVASENPPSPSELNSFRVSAVIDRLYRHTQCISKSDAAEFLNLCFSLARGIDFSIANNEVPCRSQELPSLMKQVCQNGNNSFLQAAIMVLMISIKSACRNGWFSSKDSEELSNLAKEIASGFGSVSDFDTIPNSSLPVIFTIMSRFYPWMRFGHVFAFLEIKPGFDAYMTEFQISKNVKPSPGDKIVLFVAQTNNIETSSCLVTPPKVNFLLNGNGVEKRISVSMDPGPQNPTIITHFLKYGSNLLQAVGEFKGNYVVAVAVISQRSNLDSNNLQDYKQMSTVSVDSDSEIIEGPSRISLNCPISCRRIKTPVKGKSCNHIQCFDYNNYMEINSRNPSWRCPRCNQPVCFTDICFDRKMDNILQEVGPNFSHIIISSDGSWNAIAESDNSVEKPEGEKTSLGEDESPLPARAMDLTGPDDAIDATNTSGSNDTKNPNQFQFISQNTTVSPRTANITDANQISSKLPTNNQPNAQQLQVGNPSSSNEFGMFPSIPGLVNHAPNYAVQALPVTPNSGIRQSLSNGFTPSNFSAASRGSPAAPSMLTTLHASTPQRGFRSVTNAFMSNSFPAAPQSSTASPNIPPPRHSNPHQLLQQQNSGFHSQSVANQHHRSSQQTVNLRTPQSIAGQLPSRTQSSVLCAGKPDASSNNETASSGPNDTSWRPASRMRGALTGQAYAEALNRFIVRPGQQAQAARPSLPANVPLHLQVLMSGGVAPASGLGLGSDSDSDSSDDSWGMN